VIKNIEPLLQKSYRLYSNKLWKIKKEKTDKNSDFSSLVPGAGIEPAYLIFKACYTLFFRTNI